MHVSVLLLACLAVIGGGIILGVTTALLFMLIDNVTSWFSTYEYHEERKNRKEDEET